MRDMESLLRHENLEQLPPNILWYQMTDKDFWLQLMKHLIEKATSLPRPQHHEQANCFRDISYPA